MDRPLTTDEKRYLLELARATLADHFAGRPFGTAEPAEGPLSELRGAFVTLTARGELRGCIGHVIPVAPLWQSVRQNALSAALADPRFPPLEARELPGLELEVSALTPLRKVEPGEVEVGRHGVLVQRGRFRGLLLPQVATEYGWDRETFLAHTCRKAGLDRDRWQDSETAIYVFEAEVFSEEELGIAPGSR